MTGAQITLYLFLATNIIAWIWGGATIKATVDFIKSDLTGHKESDNDRYDKLARRLEDKSRDIGALTERVITLERDLENLKESHFQNHAPRHHA